MDRTHRLARLARLLAPVALVGSMAAATPLAQAASAPRASAVATQQATQSAPSPDLTIKICWGSHCVTISF